MNLIEKYHKLNPALKSSFWFIVCSVIQKGFIFIATPFYTRMLTKEEYGYFSIYNSWLSIVMIFATFTLSAGVFNNILNKCKDEKEQNKALSVIQFLEIIFMIVAAGVLLIVKYLSGDLINFPYSILGLMMLNILMQSAYSLFMAKEKFNYRYKTVLFISILYSALTVGLSILFIKILDNKNSSLILGVVLASVGGYGVLLVSNLVRGKKFIDLKLWKYAFLFNLPLIPHYLSSIILSSSDRIMIERFNGLDSAALYSIAYSIGMLLTLVTNGIIASLVPWTYKKLKLENYDGFDKIISIVSLLYVFACFAVMLLSPEAIFLLGGEEYADAVNCVPPIVASAFFIFLYSIYGNIEFFYEKRIYTMISSVVAAALNVGLNFIFIPKYGYIAAAYTTFASYLVLVISHYIFYKIILKQMNIKKIYNNKIILLSVLIVSSFIGFSYLFYLNNIIRYVAIAVIIVITIIILMNYKKIILYMKKKIKNSEVKDNVSVNINSIDAINEDYKVESKDDD